MVKGDETYASTVRETSIFKDRKLLDGIDAAMDWFGPERLSRPIIVRFGVAIYEISRIYMLEMM